MRLDPEQQIKRTERRLKDIEGNPVAEAQEMKRRARTFEKLKRAYFREVKARREANARTPVTYEGNPYDADRHSQQKVQGAIELARQYNAANDDTWSAKWKLADNRFVSVEQGDLEAVFGLIGEQVQAAYSRESELRSQIEATSSEADLEAIDVTSGWP